MDDRNTTSPSDARPRRGRRRRFVTAAAVTAAGLVAAVAAPASSMAGTGGSDAVGILYGESSRYCEVANMAVQKRHAGTGAPVAGFEYTLYADPGVGIKAGIYDQGSKTSDVMDRDLWTRTFNQHIDRAFTATTFGQLYRAAMVDLVESQGLGQENGGRAGDGGTGVDHPQTNPGSVSERNAGGTGVVQGTFSGMIYTVDASEQVFYPANITATSGAAAQSAAMRQWVTQPGVVVDDGDGNVSGAWSVSDYAKRVKAKLDAMGRVGYFDYLPRTPKHPLLLLTGPITGGMQFTQDSVGENYRLAYYQYVAVKDAVRAAGYPNAAWSDDGTLTAGAFVASAQNWDAFVAAYATITAADGFPYGIQPADYELVRKVVGEEAVVAANAAAHRAVGATFVDDGAGEGQVTLTTDADGRVEFTMFGRLSERKNGHVTRGDCSAMQVWVEESAAPAGWSVDEDWYLLAPRDLQPEEGWLETLTLPSLPN